MKAAAYDLEPRSTYSFTTDSTLVSMFDFLVEHALAEAPDERFEESRDRFLAMLAHDLRSPLTALTVAAGVLGEDGLTERQSHLVEHIQKAAGRMKRMINELLEFSRCHSGGIPIARKPLDMGELCRQLVEEMALAHSDRTVGWQGVGDLHGEWDRDRLAQAVSNLLENALQHGKGPVRLALHDEGDIVRLEVSNQGEPIPAHQLPTLFEPFRRGERSRHGLGLGLFIAREIVRAHGGTIDVRSDVDGTVFVIRWPRRALGTERRWTQW
jgi:signal transduction histidine kinase